MAPSTPPWASATPTDEPPGPPAAADSGEVPPLVSAFTAAATSALDPEPEPEAPRPEPRKKRRREQDKPDKQVSGEFDLGEFGQFVAGLDLDRPAEDPPDS